MSGSKRFSGLIVLDELLPILDKFISDEGLIVASSHRNIVTAGFDRENIKPNTEISIYPPRQNVSAQAAVDSPGPSGSILVELPVVVEGVMPEFTMGARTDWYDRQLGIVLESREVAPRFDKLKRRLLKVMCFGPYQRGKWGTGEPAKWCGPIQSKTS